MVLAAPRLRKLIEVDILCEVWTFFLIIDSQVLDDVEESRKPAEVFTSFLGAVGLHIGGVLVEELQA